MDGSVKAVCIAFALCLMQLPAAAHADCDMIGILVTGGQTLAEIDQLGSDPQYPGDFDEPSEFWDWFETTHISRNRDGYALIYYGSDAPPPAEADVYEWPAVGNHDSAHWDTYDDNQVFRSDNQLIAGDDYAFYWAEHRIWDGDLLEHNAYLILAHTRYASGGNRYIDDPHPFVWDYAWDDASEPQGDNTDETHAFSLEHNGGIGDKYKLADMTEDLWSCWHPGETWSDVYPYKTENQGNNELVDSEAYFHWIVCNIKVAGDVEEGLRRALIAMKEWNRYKNIVFSDGSKMYAYRGLKTGGDHPDGKHRLVYRVNEDPAFIAVSSGKQNDDDLYDETEEILDHQMAEFDIDHSATVHDNFDQPRHSVLPYYCDFDDSESSTVNSSWYLSTDAETVVHGDIGVYFDGAERYLRMTNTPGEAVSNEASMYLDLSEEQGTIFLEFSYLLTGGDANPDGVFFSDDGGATFTPDPVYVMDGTPGWQNVKLNVTSICDGILGLDPSSEFVVKFVQDDDDLVDVNTIDIDDISFYSCEVCADGRPHFPDIQSAIDGGCAEIVLMDLELPGESFTGPGNRNIDYGGAEIEIRSQSGDPTLCVIDCQSLSRGFYFQDGETETSVLRDVTVRHGASNYGGAIWCRNSSPSFINCIIDSSVAVFEGGGEGGGVHCWPNSSPSFEDCIIRNNYSNGTGGGVNCWDNSSPTFVNCTVDSNSADYAGGGVYCSDDCSLEFTNCLIGDNSAGSMGGGVYCWTSSPSFSSNCRISGNSADADGGGVWCSGGEPSFTLDCFIEDNTAGADGGGVYFDNANPVTLTFESCFIEDNWALDNGGGIYCASSSPSLEGCGIKHNTAQTDDGGGVYCTDGSSPGFTECDIDSNSANYFGGGVRCENGSDPEFTSCRLNTNTVGGAGGGVSCDGSSPEFSDCDIKYNTTTGGSSGGGGVHCTNYASPAFSHCRIDTNSAGVIGGGGIYCTTYSSPTLDKCALRGNSTGTKGGGIYSYFSSPSAVNCIIWDNSAGDYGGGAACKSSSGSFEFCTFSDNAAEGAEGKGGAVYCDGSTTVFDSNIIAFSEGSGIYFKASSGGELKYCDFHGNTGGDVAYYDFDPDEGPPNVEPVFGDPLFTDREGGDFHLSDGSPCIWDANPFDYPDDDYYEDNLRPDPPFSVHPDIGADEHPGPIMPFAVPALSRYGILVLLAVLLPTAVLAIRRRNAQKRC